jgi:hypothetical protein
VEIPNLKINGLMSIPARIYPIKIGCLKRLKRYEITKAIKRINAN